MSASPLRRHSRAAAATLLAALAVGTVGASAASADAGFSFSARTSGLTRVETAVAASQTLYPDGGQDDVVLVNLAAVVDGLSASYLAGLKNAPILYTDTEAVPSATAAEIKRLGATHLWLVGGTGVISQDLQDSLVEQKFTVQRFSGADRYGTAAAVATAGPFQPERVYVTSGLALADAVVVGPVSWAKNYPILLTKSGSVPAATSGALAKLGTTDRTVIGGTAVVSDATYTSLSATKRLGGATRQETAVKVADDAVATADFTHANVALVGGRDSNAVDALSASALAGATGTPVLFIQANEHVGGTTAAYLKANRLELTADSLGLVFGGTSAVSDTAVTEATAAAR